MQRSRFAKSLAVAFVVVTTAALVPACRREVPVETVPEPQLSWGQFCNRTGTAFCQCVGVAVEACVEGAQIACLAGKDPNSMSDRTGSQSLVCERALSSNCAAAVTPGGNLPPECPPLIPAGFVFPVK